jgi:hypothetical protein
MFRKGSLFPPGDSFRNGLRIQAIITGRHITSIILGRIVREGIQPIRG